MTFGLDYREIVRLASPHGRLREIFLPLWKVPPRPVRAAVDIAVEDARVRTLRRSFQRWRGEPPDHELFWVAVEPNDLEKAFDNYHKRLPRPWIELLSWAHWVAMYLLPPEMPALRHAFEALLEVEPQLHVDAYHPNRDHVVHQIADACLAAELYQRAWDKRHRFDDADWSCLSKVIPACKTWNDEHRIAVTRAGLALAGLTHDVGYIRYIGALARERLSTVFGVTAPAPSVSLWDLARVFSGTLLERMLHTREHDMVDGVLVDLYQNAWRRADHGPLSAFVLASVARGLRSEGRLTPYIDAILQIAIAAAFLHELHPNKPTRDACPRANGKARERIDAYIWPSLFRIVDDLQCWFRPNLVASHLTRAGHLEASHIDYGADRFWIDDRTGTLTIVCGVTGRGTDERAELDYLRTKGGAGPAFTAIGVDADRNRRDAIQAIPVASLRR